jgi:hypothetical protein
LNVCDCWNNCFALHITSGELRSLQDQSNVYCDPKLLHFGPFCTDDFATNHNGFLSFYLCDVSGTPDKDIKNDPTYFKDNCHELERSPHASCESGNDKTCGPIDPKYPGRWVVPCRSPKASDQVLGGPNGKMAYKIPNKEIKHGVVQAYWLTQNTCNAPDGFMDNYKYPSAWAGCPCDGGATGAHPKQKSCTAVGLTPEEFFNCADVRVSSSGASTGSDESGPSSPEIDTSKKATTPSTTTTNTTDATESAATTVSTTAGDAAENSDVSSEEDCPPDSESADEAESDAASAPSTSAPTTTSSTVTVCTSGKQYMAPGELDKQPDDASCTQDWKQCGGIGHKGSTKCCNSAHKCVQLSAYYHQCKASS